MRRPVYSWLFVAALIILCGALGWLQYIWIDEVRVAARERLQGSLQASLFRLSQDFNSQIATAARAIVPTEPGEPRTREAIADRFQQWKRSARRPGLFRRAAFAERDNREIRLWDISADPAALPWPQEWLPLKERMEQGPERGRGGRGVVDGQGMLLEIPIFGADREPRETRETRDSNQLPNFGGPPEGPGQGFFNRINISWLILELDPAYIRETLLPEVIHSHLGTTDYLAEVTSRDNPAEVVYQSDPDVKPPVSVKSDASVRLLELQGFGGRGMARGGPGGPGGSTPGGPGMFEGRGGRGRGGPDGGRWQLFVRHRAGSLEAVVDAARWRNLAVTGCLMLLILASVAALVNFTRNAQRLAGLQMDFVAGVSHELRTPLTVIHTAAYNLRGKLAANPTQVERYGELIKQESGRLRDLVEQVLQFGSAQAGRVVQKREPVEVEAVLKDAMQSSAAAMQTAQCELETKIEPRLPLVMGDALALRHAIQNILNNAAKYGASPGNWIGVFAEKAQEGGRSLVEIRVADRGPGIPLEEQKHIFQPFFRGQKALTDQVHGTGLGLSLVKQIVEAHGGTVTVNSRPGNGTEFILRIPAAPAGYQDDATDSAG